MRLVGGVGKDPEALNLVRWQQQGTAEARLGWSSTRPVKVLVERHSTVMDSRSPKGATWRADDRVLISGLRIQDLAQSPMQKTTWRPVVFCIVRVTGQLPYGWLTPQSCTLINMCSTPTIAPLCLRKYDPEIGKSPGKVLFYSTPMMTGPCSPDSAWKSFCTSCYFAAYVISIS